MESKDKICQISLELLTKLSQLKVFCLPALVATAVVGISDVRKDEKPSGIKDM